MKATGTRRRMTIEVMAELAEDGSEDRSANVYFCREGVTFAVPNDDGGTWSITLSWGQFEDSIALSRKFLDAANMLEGEPSLRAFSPPEVEKVTLTGLAKDRTK